MSTLTDMFVAPKTPILPASDQFGALLVDLLQTGLVIPRWSLLGGELADESPADLDDAAQHDNHLNVDVLASGEESQDLLAALREAPYGRGDVAVHFSGLNFDNESIGRLYENNADIGVYALTEPAFLPWEDPQIKVIGETAVQWCFRVYGEEGPERAQGPLRDLLIGHMGPEIAEGCLYL
jgi:hypothetical protein